jgi:Domain of Unknown Function (DUF1259)
MVDNKIVICLGITVVVFSFACSITLFQQTALAQQKQTSTGNVTAQVVPQGTSLQVANKTAASTNLTGTTAPSGNVTAQIVPQGTSLTPSNNATTSTNNTGTTSGNVSAQVVPQGTSLTPSNNATGTSSNRNQGSVSAGGRLNCQSIASTIGGIAVPTPSNICDVLIPRQAPTIVGPGNMNMNKFSTINSIVEVASVSDLMIKSYGNGGTVAGASSANNTNPQNVFVMGEFSLLDPQLVTMVKSTAGYNWTIAAIHNHMVLEKPKMMFVHWSAQGDLNTITNQIKNVLLILSKIPSTSGSS